MSAFTFVLATLAVWRVTRVWIYDDIAEPARGWVEDRLVARAERAWAAWLLDLLTCPWCISVWIAGVTIVCVATGDLLPADGGWSAVVTLGLNWAALAGSCGLLWAVVERIEDR